MGRTKRKGRYELQPRRCFISRFHIGAISIACLSAARKLCFTAWHITRSFSNSNRADKTFLQSAAKQCQMFWLTRLMLFHDEPATRFHSTKALAVFKNVQLQ